MYRDEKPQNVAVSGVLRALVATAAAMAGLVSCAPGDLDDGAPADPPDERPVMPPGAPGEDVTPPGDEPALPGDEPPYMSGQLLVRFKSGTEPAAAEAVHAQHEARVLHGYRVPSNLYLVQLPEDASMEQVLAAYREDPRVLYAQPNFQYRINERFPDDLPLGNRWGLHAFSSFRARDLRHGRQHAGARRQRQRRRRRCDRRPSLGAARAGRRPRSPTPMRRCWRWRCLTRRSRWCSR